MILVLINVIAKVNLEKDAILVIGNYLGPLKCPLYTTGDRSYQQSSNYCTCRLKPMHNLLPRLTDDNNTAYCIH